MQRKAPRPLSSDTPARTPLLPANPHPSEKSRSYRIFLPQAFLTILLGLRGRHRRLSPVFEPSYPCDVFCTPVVALFILSLSAMRTAPFSSKAAASAGFFLRCRIASRERSSLVLYERRTAGDFSISGRSLLPEFLLLIRELQVVPRIAHVAVCSLGILALSTKDPYVTTTAVWPERHTAACAGLVQNKWCA